MLLREHMHFLHSGNSELVIVRLQHPTIFISEAAMWAQ